MKTVLLTIGVFFLVTSCKNGDFKQKVKNELIDTLLEENEIQKTSNNEISYRSDSKADTTFHENQQDSYKSVFFYDYPEKWSFHIGSPSSYETVTDSIADVFFNNLGNLEGQEYDFRKIDSLKNKALKDFNDSELKEIYQNLLPKKFFVPFYHKWDNPYFVDTLIENENYKLNLYKNGDKHKDCQEYHSGCDFFVVHYFLLEHINKTTGKKQYVFSDISDNNEVNGYLRYFYISQSESKVYVRSFFWDEVDRYYLGEKSLNLE